MQHHWKLAAGVATAMALAAGGAFGQSPERLDGEPNLNGVWQALNSAYWNLEPHSAEGPAEEFARLGAIGGVPAGLGVVAGGEIPYLPDARAQRDANRDNAPTGDPEAACYLPGIPRATYMNYPFQIIQGGGGGDILIAYEYASANRTIHMSDHEIAPIDTWMGLSNGTWDGDTLVVETTAQNGMTWMDRAGNFLSPTATVTERFTLSGPDHLAYEATVEDPAVYSQPWTISMPLYRRVEPSAQLLEYKCVPFADELLYGDLRPEDAE
jgi:hypothetical protein